MAEDASAMRVKRRPWSLRRRMLLGVLTYAGVLTLAVLIHGYVVNESAEQLVWETMLRNEMAYFDERRSVDPEYGFPPSQSIDLIEVNASDALPGELAGLEPGVHDELRVDGRERVVLIDDRDGMRRALLLDITEMERIERRLTVGLLAGIASTVAILTLVMAWILGRLISPLSDLARSIRSMRPDSESPIPPPRGASIELGTIIDALESYRSRIQHFLERERSFITTASHELRTPIAVVSAETELALQSTAVPEEVRPHLNRTLQTARGMKDLTALLLVLAKDPTRLQAAIEPVDLSEIIPSIVDDHRHLSAGKELEIDVVSDVSCSVSAPANIVRAAIGNLVRNAIENSDRGTIRVSVEAPATVVVVDPGHGMSAEEIARTYRLQIQDPSLRGDGIGLDLIRRLCEHLGWQLTIDSVEDRGTRAMLRFPLAHERSSTGLIKE